MTIVLPFQRKVNKFTDQLEMELAVRILRVFSDVCSKSTCDTGTCVGSVVMDDSQLIPVIVNGESFVSARHFYTHQCVCLGGRDILHKLSLYYSSLITK